MHCHTPKGCALRIRFLRNQAPAGPLPARNRLAQGHYEAVDVLHVEVSWAEYDWKWSIVNYFIVIWAASSACEPAVSYYLCVKDTSKRAAVKGKYHFFITQFHFQWNTDYRMTFLSSSQIVELSKQNTHLFVPEVLFKTLCSKGSSKIKKIIASTLR